MDIGNRFKSARLRAGLTQGEAARQIGISRQTLSNWENERTYADVEQLLMVSSVYNVSVDSLLKDTSRLIVSPSNVTVPLPRWIRIARMIWPLALYGMAVIVLCLLTWYTEVYLYRGYYDGYMPGYYTVLWIFFFLPIAAMLSTLWVTADALRKKGRWVAIAVIHLLQWGIQYGWTYLGSVFHYETSGRAIDFIGIFTQTGAFVLVALVLGTGCGLLIRHIVPKLARWVKGMDEEEDNRHEDR